MIPCYQVCKNHQCPHWSSELFDCDLLPDECEYVVEHLVNDREKQMLDGKRHGMWSFWYEDGALWYEGVYEHGWEFGFWRGWHKNGVLAWETDYEGGKEKGLYREWYENGQLSYEGNHTNGLREGLWVWWNNGGERLIERTYVKGEI